VQIGGVLTVKDANRQIRARKEEEIKKVVKKVDREAKKRQEEKGLAAHHDGRNIFGF
jgi:hypothetical protein